MKLYNTLGRHLDELKTLDQGQVKLYTCGLTVYSQPHIGNWVGYIYWDVLVRVLESDGLSVKRVQNITDVGHLVSDDDDGEDKMEKGARAEGVTAWDIADKYIAVASKESTELGLLEPTVLARATDYIDQQIAFVQELEKKGFTYQIDGEGVYFDTSKLATYGELAKLDIKGLQQGARVSIEGKRQPTDFALWKFSPNDKKRDMEWDSPWGKGFPGWHLECSVIAHETLGDQIDIHTGGIDHIPVHHTNEIAQTESLTGKKFSQIWLHNNHLKVDGQKMSKSVGNIYTLKDIKNKGYSLDAFKLFVLSKHYSTEGNFTWENLGSASRNLLHLQHWSDLQYQQQVSEPLAKQYDKLLTEFSDALHDNLDTQRAVTILNTMRTSVEQYGIDSTAIRKVVLCAEKLLGVQLDRGDISAEQKDLLTARLEARMKKDWQTSDSLRNELESQGIIIRDVEQSQFWARA